MAKRSAESQLTKDSHSDDEPDDPQTGFRRADEKTLSGRVIRGMPKRAGGTPSASPATAANGAVPDTPTPAPRFAGFGAAPSTSAATTTTSGFSFASKPFPESAASAFPAPKESSATSKMFASYLGSNPTPPASPSAGGDDGLFRYYTQLRGLNASLEDACKKALQADPFADLSPIFKHYSEHRASIERSHPGESKSAGAPSTKPSNGSTSVPPPALEFKLPSAPTSFASSPFASASASSAPSTLPATSSAPLVFPSFAPPTSAATTSSSSSPFSFSTDSPHSPPKPSKFDFAAGSKSEDSEKVTKPSFSFGSSTSFGSTDSKPSAPLFSPPASEDKPSKPGFTFGVPSVPGGSTNSASKSSFTFGSSTGTESAKPLFGSAPSGGETKTTLFPAASTAFGSSSLFSSSSSGTVPPASDSPPKTSFSAFGTGSAFGSTSTAFGSTSSAFGSTSSAFGSTSTAFGGTAGGSLGNPVGFSFGSSSSNTGAAPEPPVEESASHEGTPAGGDVAPENTGLMLEPSAYDKEGAGEEEEETVYEERCKAFKLEKRDGKSEWVDLGIGLFRCKKHKTTGARRILMRNSGSGRILLNFGVFSSLKPTLQKNVISFVAMDGSAPASFRLKVKGEDIATNLRDAIVSEVEALAKK